MTAFLSPDQLAHLAALSRKATTFTEPIRDLYGDAEGGAVVEASGVSGCEELMLSTDDVMYAVALINAASAILSEVAAGRKVITLARGMGDLFTEWAEEHTNEDGDCKECGVPFEECAYQRCAEMLTALALYQQEAT